MTGILTFTTSAAVVSVARIKPRLTFGPIEQFGSPKVVPRCDKAPQLPLPIEVSLNGTYLDWSFPQVSDFECLHFREFSGPDASPHLINGDFNDDGRPDSAVLIQQGMKVNERGVVKPVILRIVAFFNKPDGYEMREVASNRIGSTLMLMRKGDDDYDYDRQRFFTYPRDAIFSGLGLGGVSYIYEYGLFRAIIVSD